MEMFLSDSDCENFSEISSSEDLDDIDSMYGGQAQSILSNLERSIGKIDDFLSFERGFLHGDIVCHLSDPSGQLGRVVDVDMTVDLETVYGKVMKEVHCKNLRKIRSMVTGDYVVHGPWLGRVMRVVDRVTILFDDGAKCEVTADNSENLLIPLSPTIMEDSQFPYYPGQRVQVRASNVSKSAKWLSGSWKGNRDKGTVCHVEAGLVYVDWVASAVLGSSLSMSTPSRTQDSQALTLLSCFPHANWQLGDWCIIQENDWKTADGKLVERSRYVGSSPPKNPNASKEVFVIVKTNTKVDVMWQDGTHSVGLDSEYILSVNNVGDQEFWPDQFVLEKTISDDQHVSNGQKLGIVKSMDAKERTVKLQWEKQVSNQKDDSDGKYNEEIVSAYELIEYPDYSYCLGDIVFRVQKSISAVEAEIGSGSFKQMGEGIHSSKHIAEDPNQGFLCCIGNVIGFKDGGILVKWASGFTSKNEVQDNSTQDMLKNDEHTWHQKKTLPIISFPGSTETSCFGSLSKNCDHYLNRSRSVDLHELESVHENEVIECGNLVREGPMSWELEDTLETSVPEETEETTKLLFSPSCQKSGQYKQFEMVDDCTDHHFLHGSGKVHTSQPVNRGWLKKVQKEWSILEKGLPDTIYVRVYEGRIDLLRAAIVGAPGTPYHDGLFFFDFYLPPDYPNEPPLVYYNSGGLRVNPNLYESGKVCLSLLKTWTGTGSEVWNPGSSTVLQVLLSLQALVLNERPYFNEAGYDSQIGMTDGEKNSITYNENVFSSFLQHFEAFVDEHFRHCSHSILQACKEYMGGTPVGCAFGHGRRFDQEETQRCSSMGFKIMLAKLFPKLVSGFVNKGINCSEFLEPEK
ncbi:hypothetical protein MKW92_015589 [Papaver armeniacum]|nr:hypothetical protein MKW92_015589 [Papaver armeniacum]